MGVPLSHVIVALLSWVLLTTFVGCVEGPVLTNEEGYYADQYVLLATMDGSFMAVDRFTGDTRWTFSLGAPLLSSELHGCVFQDPAHCDEETIIPGTDGSLYLYSEDGLVKMRLSVAELVSSSPRYIPETNVLLIGERETRYFLVNPRTGKVNYSLSPTRGPSASYPAADADVDDGFSPAGDAGCSFDTCRGCEENSKDDKSETTVKTPLTSRKSYSSRPSRRHQHFQGGSSLADPSLQKAAQLFISRTDVRLVAIDPTTDRVKWNVTVGIPSVGWVGDTSAHVYRKGGASPGGAESGDSDDDDDDPIIAFRDGLVFALRPLRILGGFDEELAQKQFLWSLPLESPVFAGFRIGMRDDNGHLLNSLPNILEWFCDTATGGGGGTGHCLGALSPRTTDITWPPTEADVTPAIPNPTPGIESGEMRSTWSEVTTPLVWGGPLHLGPPLPNGAGDTFSWEEALVDVREDLSGQLFVKRVQELGSITDFSNVDDDLRLTLATLVSSTHCSTMSDTPIHNVNPCNEGSGSSGGEGFGIGQGDGAEGARAENSEDVRLGLYSLSRPPYFSRPSVIKPNKALSGRSTSSHLDTVFDDDGWWIDTSDLLPENALEISMNALVFGGLLISALLFFLLHYYMVTDPFKASEQPTTTASVESAQSDRLSEETTSQPEDAKTDEIVSPKETIEETAIRSEPRRIVDDVSKEDAKESTVQVNAQPEMQMHVFNEESEVKGPGPEDSIDPDGDENVLHPDEVGSYASEFDADMADALASLERTCGDHIIPTSEITFIKFLGHGASATVWKGHYRGDDVAIKLFTVSQDGATSRPGGKTGAMLWSGLNSKNIKEIEREILLLSSLRHRNIVQFMGMLMDDHLGLVTEFVDRGDLYSVLRTMGSRLSAIRRLVMGIDTARGMNFLHSLNPPIFHRDLKSPNLLVDENYLVKVADFGVSVAVHHSISKLTFHGTAAWSAPEAVANERVTEKSDLWSFGVVLWELVTLEVPYRNLKYHQIVYELSRGGCPLTIPPNVDPVLSGLMQACWNYDPARRPTFAYILEKLRELLQKWMAQNRGGRPSPQQGGMVGSPIAGSPEIRAPPVPRPSPQQVVQSVPPGELAGAPPAHTPHAQQTASPSSGPGPHLAQPSSPGTRVVSGSGSESASAPNSGRMSESASGVAAGKPSPTQSQSQPTFPNFVSPGATGASSPGVSNNFSPGSAFSGLSPGVAGRTNVSSTGTVLHNSPGTAEIFSPLANTNSSPGVSPGMSPGVGSGTASPGRGPVSAFSPGPAAAGNRSTPAVAGTAFASSSHNAVKGHPHESAPERSGPPPRSHQGPPAEFAVSAASRDTQRAESDSDGLAASPSTSTGTRPPPPPTDPLQASSSSSPYPYPSHSHDGQALPRVHMVPRPVLENGDALGLSSQRSPSTSPKRPTRY